MRPIRPPRAGIGRQKGVPNRVTRDVRLAFQQLLEGRLDDLDQWLGRVAQHSPHHALQTILGLAEFVIPRLNRAELKGTGEDGKLIIELHTFGGNDGQTDRG